MDIQRFCNSEGILSRLRSGAPQPGPTSHYHQALVSSQGGELTPKGGHAKCQAVCLTTCVMQLEKPLCWTVCPHGGSGPLYISQSSLAALWPLGS